VGLYARVSTHDQQTIPAQTRAIQEYAARRGWTIALQVKEIGSGASQRELREMLLELARRREVDIVLAWRLDRWGRSDTDLLAILQGQEHPGVGLVSLTLDSRTLITVGYPRERHNQHSPEQPAHQQGTAKCAPLLGQPALPFPNSPSRAVAGLQHSRLLRRDS
jgi:hypothetical protein